MTSSTPEDPPFVPEGTSGLSGMPEGVNVPPTAIPNAAWGISGTALTAEEVAGQDPFEGDGMRLDGIPGRIITTDDVHEGSGISEVVVVNGQVIWVKAGHGTDRADVMSRWKAWLTREEVTEDT